MLSIAITIITVFVTFRIFLKLQNILFNRKPFLWITENQWAIITGSTDGIGYEFARQLAHKGYNLMLISRNEQKLQKTKHEIMAEVLCTTTTNSDSKNIQIETLTVDFGRLDIYEQVETFLGEREVFVLVNNVGTVCDLPNNFFEGNFKLRNQEIINTNLISMVKMNELVLPSMLQRKRGLVINISSASSLVPSPLLCIYAATKVRVDIITFVITNQLMQSLN